MRFILALVILSTIVGCASRSEQAAAYNDAIINRQIEIVGSINELDSSLNDLDSPRIDEAYHILRGKIKESLRTLDTLGGFDGDDALLQAGKQLFTGYDQLADGPYRQLIELLQLPDSAYGPEQQLQSFELEEQISSGIETLHEAFEKQQLSFGERYNVKFE
ncbi:MAG: hypothetical protein RL226_1706 [Bacteroidota bacterium]|jgi:hypothetical protein